MYAKFAMCYLKMTGLDQDRQGLRRPAPQEAEALNNAEGGEAPETAQSLGTEALNSADAGTANTNRAGLGASCPDEPRQVRHAPMCCPIAAAPVLHIDQRHSACLNAQWLSAFLEQSCVSCKYSLHSCYALRLQNMEGAVQAISSLPYTDVMWSSASKRRLYY